MKPTVKVRLKKYLRKIKPYKPRKETKLQKAFKTEHACRMHLAKQTDKLKRQLEVTRGSRDSWMSVAGDIESRFGAVTKELADLKRDFTLRLAEKQKEIEISSKKASLAMRMKWAVTRRGMDGKEDEEHCAMFRRDEDASTWEQQNPFGGKREYLG